MILVSSCAPSFSLRVIFSTPVVVVYDADVRSGGVESSSDMAALK